MEERPIRQREGEAADVAAVEVVQFRDLLGGACDSRAGHLRVRAIDRGCFQELGCDIVWLRCSCIDD